MPGTVSLQSAIVWPTHGGKFSSSEMDPRAEEMHSYFSWCIWLIRKWRPFTANWWRRTRPESILDARPTRLQILRTSSVESKLDFRCVGYICLLLCTLPAGERFFATPRAYMCEINMESCLFGLKFVCHSAKVFKEQSDEIFTVRRIVTVFFRLSRTTVLGRGQLDVGVIYALACTVINLVWEASQTGASRLCRESAAVQPTLFVLSVCESVPF